MSSAPAPHVRTKVDRWPHPAAEEIFRLLEALRTGAVAVEALQAESLAIFERARLASALAKEIAEVAESEADMWLVRRHVGPCRYTLQLLHVEAGEVHPPHHHHNLISTQIVLTGQVRLREYDRVRRQDGGPLHLRLAAERLLAPGDAFQASEWHRNVHWFAAESGPAIVWNFNARGYETTTFDPDDGGPFGRRYLDPRTYGVDGLVIAEELDAEAAEARFQGRPLTADPVPAEIVRTDRGAKVRLA